MPKSFVLQLLLSLMILGSHELNAQVNLDRPSNASTKIETTVAFWAEYESSSAYTYELQISTDSNFTSLDFNDTNKRYYVIATGLKLNTKYFWRMRRWKGTDTSTWSNFWNFTTSEKPTIQGPDSGGNFNEFTPIYLHRTNHYNYEIQLDTQSSFSSSALTTIYDIDTGKTADLHLFYNGFYYNQKHFLRFRTYNTGDTSPWSAVSDFNINFKLDQQAVFNKQEASPAFNWKRPFTNETATYEVKMDTSPLFNSGLLKEKAFNALEINRTEPLFMGPALYNTLYHWSVRAMNAKDTSDWIAGNPFTTGKHTISLSLPVRFYPKQNIVLNLDTFVKVAKVFYDTTFIENNSTNLKSIEFVPSYDSKENTKDTISFKNLFYAQNYFLTIQLFNGADSIKTRNNQSFRTYEHSSMRDPYSFRKYGTETELNFDTSYSMGNYFRVQVDSNSDFSTPFFDSIYTTTIGFEGQRPKVDLELSEQYYWRVKNAHDEDTSLWSSSYRLSMFETFTAPQLTSPSNNIKLNTLHFKLQWERVFEQWGNSNDGIFYQLQYDTSVDFNSTELKNQFILDNEINYDSAYCEYFNTAYYWRVRIFEGTDTSVWSDVRSFTTADNIFRIEPENGDTNIMPSFIDWLSITGTTGYILYFDTSINLNSPNNKWIVNRNKPFFHSFFENNTNLNFNTKYYFKLAVFTNKDTLYSDTVGFTTRKRNGVVLSSPSNKAVEQTWQTLLRWNAFPSSSTNQYLIEVSENMNMSDSSAYTSNGLTRSVSLLPAKTYYWRVRAMFNNVTPSSDYSVIWSFSTKAGLDSVLLNIPADSATITASQFTFRWFNVNDAQNYDLQVGFDPSFTGFRPFNSVLLSQNVDLLSSGERYYWRVRANSSGVSSKWSEVRTFDVNLSTGINELRSTSLNIYPNPSEGIFNVEIDNGSIYQVDIFNINGKLIYTSNYKGVQDLKISPNNLGTGVYFIKTHLENRVVTSKILVQ